MSVHHVLGLIALIFMIVIVSLLLAMIVIVTVTIVRLWFGLGRLEDDSASDQPKKRVESDCSP